MPVERVLIIGGGIAGLTSAIALRRKGVAVDVAEIDPNWAVYGVGIIQQANVVRAMASLDLVDAYLSASFGYDRVQMFDIEGRAVGVVPVPRLLPAYPANLGVSRPALHKVLGDRALALGAEVRLGVTFERFRNRGDRVDVEFTDGTHQSYDLLIGADGVFSKTRGVIMPEVMPRYTGQAVWRHNFPKPPDVDCMHATMSAAGNAGLVPLSDTLMYMYLTTAEPGNPRLEQAALADLMRARMAPFNGAIAALRDQIRNPNEVVYKPIIVVSAPAPWHKGRIALIGDAAHATSPHLGSGAGLAIEDSIVLADEVTSSKPLAVALERFTLRRLERCRFITEMSEAIGQAEIDGRDVERPPIMKRMFELMAQEL